MVFTWLCFKSSENKQQHKKMQGERGSLRELQRYHRGGDGTKRRLTIGNKKDQILEEDEADGNINATTATESDTVGVPKIPKPNLASRSPKSVPRGRKSDCDNLIKEEEDLGNGNTFLTLLLNNVSVISFK